MSMKLMIAVPTTDYVHADFMKSLVQLIEELHRRRIAFSVEIMAGTLVSIARDRLACKAINEKYTHVLWFAERLHPAHHPKTNLVSANEPSRSEKGFSPYC